MTLLLEEGYLFYEKKYGEKRTSFRGIDAVSQYKQTS
jgi:hypothetical protein